MTGLGADQTIDMPAAAVRAVFDELESERGMPPCSDTSWAHIRDSKAPTFILAAHITAAAVPHIEAAIRNQIEAAAGIMAAKHKPDEKRGGCECGFCAWSVEHVAIMSVRDGFDLVARGGSR